MKAEPAATQDEAPPQLPQLDQQPPAREIKTEEETVLSPRPKQPKRTKSTLDNLFGDVFITKVEQPVSLLDKVQTEINNYLQEPVLPLTASPLVWWKANCHKFPLLAKAARCILCVPATSVPSERVFSTAGDKVTAQHASLSPQTVDILVFLKKNFYVP